MDKPKPLRWFVIFLFIAALIALIFVASAVMERKFSDSKYSDFFANKENIDVFFVGNSHVEFGISPLQLWKEQGISSYNFGNSSACLPLSYWVSKLALEQHKPELVVVDIYMLQRQVYYLNNGIDVVHDALDCFPLSVDKIRAVWNVVPYEELRPEFLFTFAKYHSRWKDISANDFYFQASKLKGLMAYENPDTLAVWPQPENSFDPSGLYLEEETLGTEYLRRLIELCQSEDIPIMLTLLPHYADEAEQRAANTASLIAEEYGINYVNLLSIDNIVDICTDFYDKGHVNPSGMQKVTTYLGEYISENYEISRHRDDPEYQVWDDDYKSYVQTKLSALADCEDLASTLMLLHDSDLSFALSIEKDSSFYSSDEYCDLLQNTVRAHVVPTDLLNAHSDPLKALSTAAEEQSSYTLVVDNVSGKVYESLPTVGDEDISCSFGLLSLSGRSLFIDDGETDYFSCNDEIPNANLRLAIFDNSTGQCVMTKIFQLTPSYNESSATIDYVSGNN